MCEAIEITGLTVVSSIWAVHIDKDLTWKTHVNHLWQTYLAVLAMIKHAGHHLPCHVCKLLYQSFILSNLDYCSVVWNSCGEMLSKKYDRLHTELASYPGPFGYEANTELSYIGAGRCWQLGGHLT